MPALRFGLVGTGDAGKHHARALAALHAAGAVDFAAITCRDPARAEATLIALAAPPTTATFSTLDDLVAARAVDAVILATPDGQHAAQTNVCAAAGLHVLCEKPLALSAADARGATAAACAAGTVLVVGYHLRHHTGHVALRERLGELVGPVRAIDVRWAWPDPAVDGWRARGDGARWWSLAALGTHAIDLVMWLCGGVPVEVQAMAQPHPQPQPQPHVVDLAAEVLLRMPGGVLAHVSCAVTHREAPRLLIAGDAGEDEAVHTLGPRGAGTITLRRGRDAPVDVPFTPVDPYLAQLRAFVARIAAGDTTPDHHAVANLEVLEQVVASR